MRFDGELLRLVAGAFASDVTDLMGADRTPLWIFGHTHVPADLDVDGTRVFSNPRGYVRESIPEFDPAATVDVSPVSPSGKRTRSSTLPRFLIVSRAST